MTSFASFGGVGGGVALVTGGGGGGGVSLAVPPPQLASAQATKTAHPLVIARVYPMRYGACSNRAPMQLTRSLLFSLGAAFVLLACSDSTDSLDHRGSRSAAQTGASAQGPGSTSSSPAGGTAHSDDGPAPVPTTGSAVSAPPPPPNTCANPTCTVADGACGCTANDADGTTVAMDCQDGVCTCTSGDQITTQFGDDGCASDADARTLYFANCQCL
jgi:hypothetical protein